MPVLSRGVDIGGAADDGEAVAVGLDVGVAGCGAGLHEGVVGRDVGGGGVALGRGEEDQPELCRRWSVRWGSGSSHEGTCGGAWGGGGALDCQHQVDRISLPVTRFGSSP